MKNHLPMVLASFAIVSPVLVSAEEPTELLPRCSSVETTHTPIDTETYRNQVVKAYVKALKEKKYTLVLFSRSHQINPFAKRMVEKLKNPVLAEFSDQVVMCLCDPELDSSCEELHTALEVNAYPSLFLIKTNREKVQVMVKIVGECETPVLNSVLTRELRKAIEDTGRYAEDIAEQDREVTDDRNADLSISASKEFDTNIFRDRTFDAYMKALRENKYTLVLLSQENNGFAERMERKLKDPRLSQFVDQSILTVADPQRDSGAKQLQDALDVMAYPTLLVLNTDKDRIHLVGQISGEVEVNQIVDVLERSMNDSSKGTTKTARFKDNGADRTRATESEPPQPAGESQQHVHFTGSVGFTDVEQVIADSQKKWEEINRQLQLD